MIYVVEAKCVDKEADYEFIRKWILFGKKISNPQAVRYLYCEIEGEKIPFLVNKEDYDNVDIGDCGTLEYEIISNTYKLERFTKNFYGSV